MTARAALAAVLLAPVAAAAHGPFAHRGYYLTLTRTPTFGLDAWKETIDAVRADGGNLVILWTAGGFRSKKFPDTWGHNADHANVRKDFVRDLIDYAHERKVRVLLGLTPFGYDGVNRMAGPHPEWAATGPDGKPAKRSASTAGDGTCALPGPTCRGSCSTTRMRCASTSTPMPTGY